MFFEMVNTYKHMNKNEKNQKRTDFRGLIRNIESIVIEEHGLSHILNVITDEYLKNHRKL